MLTVTMQDGWTVVTPGADSKVVYVSSSTGSDGNNGLSENSAVASIAKGRALLRSGTGDQLLLKRGDTWTESLGYWKYSGKSADQPMVIGTYGTGDRPVISNGTSYAFGLGSGTKLHDVVVEGISFYAAQRDPNNPQYNPNVKADGIYIAGNFDNLLFEDVSVQYYTNNFVVSDYFGPATDFKVRRSNISYAYSDAATHSQGMYVEGIDGILLEENTFDHNGWSEQVSNAKATIFNHNAYIQGESRNLVARGNVFANAASHGLQARPGRSSRTTCSSTTRSA